MTLRSIAALALVLLAAATGVAADTGKKAPPMSPALLASIDELRHAHGRWNAVTEFLRPDGTVAHVAKGTYTFEWLVPDRVLSGVSEIPDLDMKSGILFYVSETKAEIEMASVGVDGHLWVMTGPAGGDTRTTPPTKQSDGSTVQLRFTRYNVAPDRFESRMEITSDGGKTWQPGNHQVLERIK